MNTDLTRLIQLQRLETAAEDARRRIADHPARAQTLDARLQSARDAVAAVKTRLAAATDKRRAEEKEVASVQTRLAKYKDQLLEVKTNREYTAMLHEIEAAQKDIRGREDRILEVMLESDELNAGLKKSEAELKTSEKEIATERSALDAELATLQSEIDRCTEARQKTHRGNRSKRPQHVRNRRQGAQRRGNRRGKERPVHICHVRLRPQIFNEIRRNASIIQCDSCQRNPLLRRRE
jgi:predicted  nucleic acid-binding Zn-ribbon protein